MKKNITPDVFATSFFVLTVFQRKISPFLFFDVMKAMLSEHVLTSSSKKLSENAEASPTRKALNFFDCITLTFSFGLLGVAY